MFSARALPGNIGERRGVNGRGRKRRGQEEDFSFDPSSKGTKKSRTFNLGQIVLVGGLSTAFLGLLIGLYVKEPPPRKERKKKERVDAGIQDVRRKKTVEARATTDFGRRIVTLSEDILNIAPHIYSFVRLEMVNGQFLDQNSELLVELEITSVQSIEFHVRSRPWDELPSTEKVDLLNRTFNLLKTRYP